MPTTKSKATQHYLIAARRTTGLTAIWFVCYVADQVLDAFQRFALRFFVRRYRAVPCFEAARRHMRPRRIVEEPADPSRPDDLMPAPRKPRPRP